MAIQHRSASPTENRTPIPPAKKRSSHVGIWVTALILLALGGGAYYHHQQQEQARLKAEARQAALVAQRKAEKKRLAEEAARQQRAKEEAQRKAEEAEKARLAAEEAEKARIVAQEKEQARLAAEEEARRIREAEEEAHRKLAEQKKQEEKPQPAQEKKSSPYDVELPLVGEGSTSLATRDQFQALIDRVLKEGDFEEFATVFDNKIKSCVPELISGEKLNYAAFKRNNNLVQAIDLCELIHLGSPDLLRSIIKGKQEAGESRGGNEAGTAFLSWGLRDKSRPFHSFLQAFISNGGHQPNMSYSLQTFYELWDATPEKERAEYVNLAIACSLLSPVVANSRGMLRDPSAQILTVPQVYQYFREMDGKKKLLTNIKKMSISDLLYVVDVRLPRSEFNWVMDNLNYSQANWGDAYKSIRYLMERATQGKDPYQKYTFAEIQKEGGVCRDQAYFAANTAKCKGIPAVYIVGDGDRGPHAWIASLTDKTTWKQSGSYGYNTGRFTNPCSGRAHHESVLLNKSKKTTDDKLQDAYDGMLLSDYFVRSGCTAEARATARFITTAFPVLTMAWVNRISILGRDEEHPLETAEWRKISNTLIQQGRKNPELIDLAQEIENDYLLEGKSASAKKSALKRSTDKLKKSVGNERSDLVLDSVQRQAEALAETGDWRGIAKLYKGNLKDFASRGDVFESLLSQYMGLLTEADTAPPSSAWSTLAKDADAIFNKYVLSGGGDYFKVKKECSIMNLIATAYEKTGNAKDAKKADKIRQLAQDRLESSKGNR